MPILATPDRTARFATINSEQNSGGTNHGDACLPKMFEAKSNHYTVGHITHRTATCKSVQLCTIVKHIPPQLSEPQLLGQGEFNLPGSLSIAQSSRLGPLDFPHLSSIIVGVCWSLRTVSELRSIADSAAKRCQCPARS